MASEPKYRPPIMIVTPVAPATVVAPCGLPYPRLIAGVEPKHKVREVNINLSRSYCQSEFLKHFFHKFEFVLLMDADVVIKPGIVDKLLNAWKQGLVPCANTKGNASVNPEHGAVTSCALIHRADYEKVDYLGNLGLCQCRILNNRFHTFYVKDAYGYEVKYK